MSEIQLREYQARLVDAVRDSARIGCKKILMVLPTGGGKSFIAAEITKRSVSKGHKVLILTHMRQLVRQMSQRLSEYGVESSFIMAGEETAFSEAVQVCTIQTYSRRLKLDELDNNRFFIDASVVIIDEAHRSMSKTYQDVLSHYSGKIVIGITATPVLSSGLGMGEYYDALVDKTGIQELINLGHLVPVRYFAPSQPDLSAVKVVMGDYQKKQLAEAMDKPKLIGDVFCNWARIAGGKKTMVFAVNVKHSKSIRDQFRRHGVTCEHLDAHSKEDVRGSVIEKFVSGDIQVITNVGLYTEGTDIPEIECIQIVRPTKSMGLWRQMAGRGLRPSPGKEDVILIDHGGCVDRLGFIEDDVMWSLDGKKIGYSTKKKPMKEKAVMTCDMCRAAFKGHRCPSCGYEIPDYGKKIEALEADLVELKPKKMTMYEKQEFWGMLEYYRMQHGYKPGWTFHKYREKTGVKPVMMDGVGPVEPDAAFLNYIKHLQIKWAKRRVAA